MSEPKCMKCDGAISEIVREWFKEQKRKKGERETEPKVCGACVFTALMSDPPMEKR
jgi:hypothetical protein